MRIVDAGKEGEFDIEADEDECPGHSPQEMVQLYADRFINLIAEELVKGTKNYTNILKLMQSLEIACDIMGKAKLG